MEGDISPLDGDRESPRQARNVRVAETAERQRPVEI
jgi:hypothetical protein